jgi:hypothetical protein
LTGTELHAQAKMGVGDDLYGKEHNWNHVSCFWDLPYFKNLLLCHTIDVKNVAESIWSTCFDIPDRTKDNVKAMKDLELICNRTKLHIKKCRMASGTSQELLFELRESIRLLF